MDYSKIYPIVKKVPKPVRDFAIRFINKRRLARVMKLKTPSKLVYFVTHRCNARCAHCFYWRDIRSHMNEMSLEEIKKVSASMGPIESMSLTGGEAILRDDLVEIMKTFYKNNGVKKFTLPTNGSMTEILKNHIENAFKRLPDIDLHVQISIDGMRKFHDKFRGVPGIFDKAVESVKMLNELKKKYPGLHSYVITTITNKNYREVKPLIKFVKTLHVDHKFQLVRGAHFSVFNINPKVLSDFDPEDKEVLLPTFDQMWEIYKILDTLEYEDPLYKEIQKLKFKYSIEMLQHKRPAVKCLAGKLDGVLYPDGKVAICEMTKPFANVRDFNYNFKKLWNSAEANEMRKQTRACFCTHSCNLVDSMVYDDKTLIRLANNG